MKKCLLTGCTGFVGSCLVRTLLMEGYNVHIIIRKTSNLWRIKDILNKVNIHYESLENEIEIRNLIKKEKFNYIFHLATFGGYYYENSKEKIFNSNVLGTWNLINAISEIGVDCFVNTSSSSEYGEKDVAMEEDMVLKPNTFYGATKVCSTMLTNIVAKENKLPMYTLRLFSPYGYFDGKSRLIPTVILNSLKNSDINLGNMDSKRDFIFIEDVVKAYLDLINLKDRYGEIYNVASGKEYTVFEIANKIIALTNSKSNIYWNTQSNRQNEPKNWYGGIEKINKELNWKAEIEIDEGLAKTIKWFEKYYHLY